jgi:hypothetical protein
MRRIGVLASAILCACSTAPAQPVVHGETPGHICKEAGTDAYLGQPRSDAAGSAIKRSTNAAVLRWAPPGIMLTMDFRADRVTVWLGPDDRITRIRCG